MIEPIWLELRKIEFLNGFDPEGLNVSPEDRGMSYALSGYIKDFQIKAKEEKDGICIAIIHDPILGPYVLAEMTQNGSKFILFNAEETTEQEGTIKVILNSQDGTHKWVKYKLGSRA